MNVPEMVTALISATLIAMIWSIMYRENRFYRIAENVTIGGIFGFTSYTAVKTLIDKTFSPLAATGSFSLVAVTFFGFVLWLRLIPKLQWVSRYTLALMAGVSMAVGVRGAIGAQIIKQALAASWIVANNLLESFNNIIVTVFGACVVAYFLYTREHTGVLRPLSVIAKVAMMFGFGAILGTFLMGNTAFSIGQIGTFTSFPGVYVALATLVLIVIDIARGGIKEKAKD